jgi:hypothetical protein
MSEPTKDPGPEAPPTPAAGSAVDADAIADTDPALEVASPPAPFAHHSEAEFARILDFYEVRWVYEPHVFPILWSLDGAVLESFAPDFYLPDLDLYVELTTLRQRLVRKKNRKLRRLRELYPDVRIKLFYARDFRMLMLKYGKLAIADELSGTVGQVVSGRSTRVSTATADLAAPIVEGSAAASSTAPPIAPAPTAAPAAASAIGATRKRQHREASVR